MEQSDISFGASSMISQHVSGYDVENTSKAFDWIKKHGIPGWKEQQMRESARDSAHRHIDHDIGVLMSMSLTAKMHMQVERNYKGLKDGLFEDHEHANRRTSWLKKIGIEWF